MVIHSSPEQGQYTHVFKTVQRRHVMDHPPEVKPVIIWFWSDV